MSSSAEMPTVTLHTGAKMPAIGLGTWLAAPGEVGAAVEAALKAGYRHIDGAAMYGNEKEVGEALAKCFSEGVCSREDVFVTSKLRPQDLSPEYAVEAFEKTCSDLGLEYLDLYLIHWPFQLTHDCTFPPEADMRLGYDAANISATWKLLEGLVSGGKARHIGVSNFSPKKLTALLATAAIKPAVVQVESHPALAQKALMELCGREGIFLTAYSPLGNPGRPDRLKADGDPAPMSEASVLAIAEARGCSPAQVLIKWAIQRGTVVIPKSTSAKRIAENLASVELAPLTEEELKTIDALDGGGRIIKGAPFTVGDQTWKDLWDEE